MAKRRAENPLLLDSPGKRKLCRPLCGVDMRLESSAAPTSGAVSPPSLLALLGGRSEDAPVEDSIYNSFQYWRVPLPELNLSLLEDPSDDSQTKTPSKNPNDSPSDAMET
uniref:Uncharacterized protein n=1 Tax=Kryptolebias marmoratus TaxID=37003 RepID=A0A3Q2ZKJ9_KRYMA